jgi:hypothetical protein
VTGPTPLVKFPTITSQLTRKNVQNSLLLFRTNPTARSTRGFLSEIAILPPLSVSVTVHTLLRLAQSSDQLAVLFADEEANSYAVELAARLHGYVLSKDSDFSLLYSEGYQGYIPLDEVRWTSDASLPDIDIDAGTLGELDGFTRVKKVRRGPLKPSVQFWRGLIPPEGSRRSACVLSLEVYQPTVLAAHLKLPTTLLPLLGAFVGSDSTSPDRLSPRGTQALLFGHRYMPIQRIERTAAALNAALAKPTPSVTALIERAIQAMLRLRGGGGVSNGEVTEMVERITEAALHYAIPPRTPDNVKAIRAVSRLVCWPGEVCPLHSPTSCPILRLFRLVAPSTVKSQSLSSSHPRVLYLLAYGKGLFASEVMDILHTGTAWPQLFLEDPDLETIAHSVGNKLREWIYAILDEGIGLGREEEKNEELHMEGGDSIHDAEADEVVEGVNEVDDDDLLVALKGESQWTHAASSRSPLELSLPSTSPRFCLHPGSRPMAVATEYVRRGTHVVPADVTFPLLADLLTGVGMQDHYMQTNSVHEWLPIQLWPESDRLTVLLRALESDLPSIRSLAPQEMGGVLALRWVVRTMDLRAGKTMGTQTQLKERVKERWTTREARAFLDSFAWATPECALIDGEETEATLPPIYSRNIQLCSQVLMALESIEWFAQTLLLVPGCVVSPAHIYSGRKFHTRLTNAIEPNSLTDKLWEAAVEGLISALRDEDSSPKKKRGKGKTKGSAVANRRTPDIGLFGWLADSVTE